MTGDDSCTLALDGPTLASLAGIRTFVAASLTTLACTPAIDALTLAVDEVCANVVMHGFAGRASGRVVVTVRRDESDAVVEVEDDGTPFDPAHAAAPSLDLDWETRPVGGLGWFLVRQMVDRLHYETTHVGDGVSNRLILTKRNVASTDTGTAPHQSPHDALDSAH